MNFSHSNNFLKIQDEKQWKKKKNTSSFDKNSYLGNHEKGKDAANPTLEKPTIISMPLLLWFLYNIKKRRKKNLKKYIYQ